MIRLSLENEVQYFVAIFHRIILLIVKKLFTAVQCVDTGYGTPPHAFMKPHHVFLALISIATAAALIKFPLSPCPASYSFYPYQCHTRDIENFGLLWLLTLVVSLPIFSVVYQYRKIRQDGRKPTVAFIRYLGVALPG